MISMTESIQFNFNSVFIYIAYYCKVKILQSCRENPNNQNNQTALFEQTLGNTGKEKPPFKRKKPSAEPGLGRGHLVQTVGVREGRQD